MSNENEDPMNSDEFTEGGEHGWVGKPVVSYNIVFQQEDELKRFYEFIKLCRKKYPTTRTIGERIDKFLRDDVLSKENG